MAVTIVGTNVSNTTSSAPEKTFQKSDTAALYFEVTNGSAGDKAWVEVHNGAAGQWHKMEGTVVENSDVDSNGRLAIALSPIPASEIRLNADTGEWSLWIAT